MCVLFWNSDSRVWVKVRNGVRFRDGVGSGLGLSLGLSLECGFYVTNFNCRVRDRVIFTNHIPVIDEGYETRILVSTFPIVMFS